MKARSTITIFYSQNSWQTLLSSFIIPQILSLDLTLDDCHIHFSDRRGAHLTLTLFTYSNLKDEILKSIATDAATFLRINPSPDIVSEQAPSEPFFMDFSNNTFYTDQDYFRSPFHKNMLNRYHQIYAVLSQLIISALRDEPLDAETLISFALYLKLAVLHVATQHENQEMDDIILQIVDYSGKSVNKIDDDDQMTRLLGANEQIITDIYNDVIDQPRRPELKWLQTWEDRCMLLFKRTDLPTIQTIFDLTEVIDDQLGLNKNVSIKMTGMFAILHSKYISS